jgi:two-component system, NtrC family, nitrogen regulation sensor histidine kinase NtrY
MDAPAAESNLTPVRRTKWLERQRESGWFYRYAAIGTGALLIVTVALSAWLLQRPAEPGTLLSPPMIALLLVANLIPAIVLMVLLSRRIAMARAEQGGLGTGRLHTRLVALFSAIAAVPTVLVAIFASLLFQSGLEFWFSDRARGMLENSVTLARSIYDREVERVGAETVAMSGDLASYLDEIPIDDPTFVDLFGRQVLFRNLSEAVIINVGQDDVVRSLALVNPYDRPLDEIITPGKIEGLADRDVIPVNSPDRVGALARLEFGPSTYLYASRVFEPEFQEQIARGNDVLRDYRDLLARSRANQLRFNAALLLGSLVIVALAILAALRLADRLVRPIGQLATAAGRIEQGDFSARVPVTETEDEIETLAMPSTG